MADEAAAHGLADVLRRRGEELLGDYAVRGTPSAVLVDEDGTIARPVAEGADEIRALIATVHGADARAAPLIVERHEPRPELEPVS
ncbi:MAG: hypothetical protein PGN13_00240 [Patulibacter minatonensis]